MGYNTEFRGELKFNKDLTGPQLARLKSFLGEDCRQHPEWEVAYDRMPHCLDFPYSRLSYIDLGLNQGFDGVKWNGSEKTYDLIDKVNLVTSLMQEIIPDFKFVGFLEARGEQFDDTWNLVVGEDGWAERQEIKPLQCAVTCPHCTHRFVLRINSASCFTGDEDITYRY